MSDKIREAHSHIEGKRIAEMIMDFTSEFRAVYGNDTFNSSLCAVGPLQSLIGLAIRNGKLSLPSPTQSTSKEARE